MTPDNGIFAIVAYALAGIVYAGYSAILIGRERALRAKLDALEDQPRR